MKNLLTLTLLLLGVTTSNLTLAQTFGFRAGLNYSTITGETEQLGNIKGLIGYHFGPTVDVTVNNFFSIETGVLFSTQGFKREQHEEAEENYMYESAVRLNYLNIPITAKVEHELPTMTIYGAIGPYVAIGLGGKAKTTFGLENNLTTTEQDVEFGKTGDFKPLDFGLTVASGVQINNIQLGISYNQGFSKIIHEEREGPKLANQVVSIFVTYTLNFKKN